jgi:hypothetical protein
VYVLPAIVQKIVYRRVISVKGKLSVLIAIEKGLGEIKYGGIQNEKKRKK